MRRSGFVRGVALVAALGALLLGLVVVAPPAHAQQPDDRYVPCAAYGVITGSGGQAVADAAEELRLHGAPNPPGIENALQTIINDTSDVPPIGSRPSFDAVELAYDTLADFFGPVCTDINVCPLAFEASLGLGESARLLRGLVAPAPPGIDAALALISGAITVEASPFHESVEAAQLQVSEYFACDASSVDVCTLVDQIVNVSDGVTDREAAGLLGAIEAPAPPGIGAALAFIAGEIGESPFHDSIADAKAQIASYYTSCDVSSVDVCTLVDQIVNVSDGVD